MAYAPETAERIRVILNTFPEEFEEKSMFGGLSFLYRNKMTVGIVQDELAVRVISSKMEDVLKKSGVRPMDFTKRPMKEFVFVSGPAFDTEAQLSEWIELGLEHAKTKN